MNPYIDSLEVVFLIAMIEPEKWNRIRHHPDVASTAVEIRFAPSAIFVRGVKNFVCNLGVVGGVIQAEQHRTNGYTKKNENKNIQ